MSEVQRRLGLLPMAKRMRFLDLIRANGGPPGDRPTPRTTDGDAPLTNAQAMLWFQECVAPGTPTYNVVVSYRILGRLDTAALEAALSALAARHESLRTWFPDTGAGPAQRVDPPRPFTLPVTVVSGATPEARRERAGEAAADLAWRPFVLERPPLWRAEVFETAADDHLFVFAVHHAVVDGLSVEILMRELSALYGDRRAHLPALPIQPADYATWQREWLAGPRLDQLTSYWRQRLQGVPVLDLQTDHPRPRQMTLAGAVAEQPIDRDVIDRVHALADQLGVTTYVVYLTAFVALLRAYTRQTDVVVGASTAGRNRPELADVVGCFVNMLPIRVDADGTPTFAELVGIVDRAVKDAFTHGDLPFGQIVQAASPPSDPSRSPLVQVVFNLLAGLPQPSLGDLEVTPHVLRQSTSKFDLTWEVADSAAGSRVGAEYRTHLFEPETIERMLAHYAALLASVAKDPHRVVRVRDFMARDEVDELVHGWDGVRRPVIEATIPARFEAQAARTPDAVALVAGGGTLTYGELERMANRLAHVLRDRGAGPGRTVALLLPRGADYVVSVLATLKAGAAFAPLDPSHPNARLAALVDDARPAVLVTDSAVDSGFASAAAVPVVVKVDEIAGELARVPATRPPAVTAPGDLAYVLYTSGTTGAAKGVEIEHRSVVNFVEATRELFALTPDDCILGYAAHTFDVSIFEMFGALLNGARLCLALDGDRLDIDRLQRLLADNAVTVTDLPPSVMAMLTPEPLDRLRIVFVGGEAFPGELVTRWNKGRRLFNGYGPTECTVTMTTYECQGAWSSSPPIGLPIRNHVAHVVDEHLDVVPYGVPGELVIGGVGLARGYLGQPELTRERFVEDPFGTSYDGRLYRTGDLVKRNRRDGSLVFLGRIDRQLKVRGIRIEAGEIEAALASHEAVSGALVETWTDDSGVKHLVAYVTTGGVELGADALRLHVSSLVPAAVVPEFFVVLPEIPLTTSGKVDRRALPAPRRPEPASAGQLPGSDVERILAEELWGPLLGLSAIDVDANFFELGGGSLQAAQLISDIRHRFEVELAVFDFFQNPTIAGLAAVVERQQQLGPVGPDVLLDGLQSVTSVTGPTGAAGVEVRVSTRPEPRASDGRDADQELLDLLASVHARADVVDAGIGQGFE